MAHRTRRRLVRQNFKERERIARLPLCHFCERKIMTERQRCGIMTRYCHPSIEMPRGLHADVVTVDDPPR